MTLLFLLWALAQPDTADCNSRRPGLHCLEYETTKKGITCSAICAYGSVGEDGGTASRKNVYQREPVKDHGVCWSKLAAQCK